VQKAGGQPFFVEVKYRASGRLSKADLGPHYPHPTAFVVLVSPYRIQCIPANDLNNGQELRPDKSDNLFAARPEFQADLPTVYEFVDLAAKLFAFDK